MSYVIDRRLNGKNKSTVNRQRFLRRYKSHIKKAVEEAVGHRSITDIEHGENISIPGRDIDEPIFHHGQGGRQTQVHPGNKEFSTGDRFARPQGGGGSGPGGNQAGDSGEGMDEFVFQSLRVEVQFRFSDRRAQQVDNGVRQDKGRLLAESEAELLPLAEGFHEGEMLAADFLAALDLEDDIGQDELRFR